MELVIQSKRGWFYTEKTKTKISNTIFAYEGVFSIKITLNVHRVSTQQNARALNKLSNLFSAKSKHRVQKLYPSLLSYFCM